MERKSSKSLPVKGGRCLCPTHQWLRSQNCRGKIRFLFFILSLLHSPAPYPSKVSLSQQTLKTWGLASRTELPVHKKIWDLRYLLWFLDVTSFFSTSDVKCCWSACTGEVNWTLAEMRQTSICPLIGMILLF